MQNAHYALVAYVRNPVGEFVAKLRRDLHPDLPHLPAHVTILPPRCLASAGNCSLRSGESEAMEAIAEACRDVEPFELTLGDVETFVPVTPTVFIRVEHGAYRLRELHDRLNCGPLSSEEQWPYMPHLTIVKMALEQQALDALEFARERWGYFTGTHRIVIEELTFVRENDDKGWVDLAPIRLGRSLVSR